MSVILGQDLMVFVGDKPIAYSTTCKLSTSATAEDLNSKDSGEWDESIITKFGWSVTSDALLAVDETETGNLDIEDLWASYIAKSLVTIKFAQKSGTSPAWVAKPSSKAFVGSAYITKLDANADKSGAATFSIEFKGNGKLERVTLPL